MQTKPLLDLQMMAITIHLKPWKGKISAITTVLVVDRSKFLETIEERIEEIKKEGRHKRRTITSVSFTWGEKL